MKIPGLPAEAIQGALQATVVRHAPVLPTAAAVDTALPVVPVNPTEPAAAVRILLEEIRLAMLAELGELRARLPAPAPGESPAEAAERAVRFLRAALTEAAAAGRRLPQARVEALIGSAGERALAVAARAPAGAAPATAIVVGEVGQEILRALPAGPAARIAPTPASVPSLFVEQLRIAIEERLGMLPASAMVAAEAGEVSSPQQALAAAARLFRAAVEDPVIAVRASSLSLAQALELGAARTLSLASAGPGSADAGVLVADLRAIAARQLSTGSIQAPAVSPQPPVDLRDALGLLQAEIRQALSRNPASPAPPAVPSPAPPATADLRSIAASLVNDLAQAARAWPDGDPRATRSSSEATLEVALRRTLLQLPATMPQREQLAARLTDAGAETLRLMAAAEAAAPRAADWARPAVALATALLRGQEPPFRLDVPVPRPAAAAKPAADDDEDAEVDAIESSDPEERGQDSGRKPRAGG